MPDGFPPLVRQPACQALVRRLDAAVARDGRLREARDAVLRPISLLKVMAEDVAGALADDVLRADRLRAMLFLAWPYAAVATEARTLLAASTAAGASEVPVIGRLAAATGGTGAIAWPPEQPYEPGILDHAALLVLALGAARVADAPFAPELVATVHGLALAASAAEVLGRLDPRQPDAEALEVVLEVLYVIESARTVTRNEFLRPFVFDPVERGRWRCLEQTLARSKLMDEATSLREAWDGATSHEILRVRPRAAAPGETVVLTVRRPIADPDTPGSDDPLHEATVVFASADGPLRPTGARLISSLALSLGDILEVEVDVPPGATPGWIGFSRADMIRTSKRRREGLQAAMELLLDDPCIDAADRLSPAKVLPPYGALATPRRRALNRFEGGVPVIVFAGIAPATARPGERVVLSWETAGASAVDLDGAAQPASGSLELVAPARDGRVAYVITPVLRGRVVVTGAPRTVELNVVAPLRVVSVDVEQEGRAAPLFEGRDLDVVARLEGAGSLAEALLVVDDGAAIAAGRGADPRRLVFQVPAARVRDGMTLTVVVTDRAGGREQRSVGPLRVTPVQQATVVLARPRVLDGDAQLSLAEAERRLEAVAASLGVAATVIDLPWSDDELAVLLERPAGDGDPSLLRLLEALARRALLTPRFEDAVWLALLPGTKGPRGVARWTTAYAARALVAATTSGLPRALAAIFAPATTFAAGSTAPVAAAGPHLAILGAIDDDEVTVELLRVDERGSAGGPPVESRLDVVTVDADGRELERRAARVVSSSRPAQLALLVPVSAEVGAVELRGPDGRALAVLRRARGELSLDVKAAGPNAPRTALDWEWSHTHNARPRVSLLLERDGLATPVYDVDPCRPHVELPLWRYAAADRLGLFASDGWNGALAEIGEGGLENGATAVVRRLSDGRFYADVPDGYAVTWKLNGAARDGTDRLLRLAAGDNGRLEVEARLGAKLLRDARQVAPGEVR